MEETTKNSRGHASKWNQIFSILISRIEQGGTNATKVNGWMTDPKWTPPGRWDKNVFEKLSV